MVLCCLLFVNISFSSVWVAEWKELLTRLIVCSLCILTFFFILVIFRFGFENGIAPVPGHCILVTFNGILKWDRKDPDVRSFRQFKDR